MYLIIRCADRERAGLTEVQYSTTSSAARDVLAFTKLRCAGWLGPLASPFRCSWSVMGYFLCLIFPDQVQWFGF